MGFKQFYLQENYKLKGKTSEDNGHTHTYVVDEDGNGETSSDGKGPHIHKIDKYKVVKEVDHIHILEKE